MRCWPIVPLLAAALAIAPSARAGTVDLDGTLLLFGSGSAEGNHLTISENTVTRTIDFSDTGAAITSSTCSLPGSAPHHLAQCSPFDISQHIVYFGTGDDYVFDEVGPLEAAGGYGNDQLFGSPVADQLEGGQGNDHMYGDGGNDFITDGSGGGGNDWLLGDDGPGSQGSGNDTLDGGSMVDGSGAGSDLLDGDDGFDTADYSRRTAPLNISDTDVPNLALPGDATGNDGQAGEHDNVVNIEHLIGGSAGDVLSAGGADSVLEGAGGNDMLVGGPGNDSLYGGWAGPDEANAGATADTLGTGNDTFDGGGGADMFHGGDGTDTVTYASRSTPVTVTLDGLPDDGGPGEHDNVLSDIEVVDGGAGADHLVGNSGANTLNGGAGSDAINGLGGDDVLRGGTGNDSITGGTGDDTISGGAGNDTILARDGSPDTITCGPGNDTVMADAVDSVATDCEHVLLPPGTTTAPAEVSLPSLVAFQHGSARVSLSCPRLTPGGCATGRLTLSETAPRPGPLAWARFTIAAGDHVVVRLRIRTGVLSTLRKARHLMARLVATAVDAHHVSATASRVVQLDLGR